MSYVVSYRLAARGQILMMKYQATLYSVLLITRPVALLFWTESGCLPGNRALSYDAPHRNMLRQYSLLMAPHALGSRMRSLVVTAGVGKSWESDLTPQTQKCGALVHLCSEFSGHVNKMRLDI